MENHSEKNKRMVLVFTSVHDTLKAETFLKKAPWPFQLVPVPPAINKGCGLAVAVSEQDQQSVEDYLKENDIIPIKSVTL